MKKILQLIESSETGGAENVFVDLVSRINQKNYQVLIGLFETGWLSNQLESKGYRFEIFTTKGSFDVTLIKRLVTYVKTHDIDMLHAHLFGTAVYGSIVAKLCGIPIVCTLHGTMDVGENERFCAFKFWIVNTFVDRLIFVSESLKHYFMERGLGRRESSFAISNGIDVNKYHPRKTTAIRNDLGYSDNAILVGAVGDLRPQKGYDVLIRAADILRNQVPNINFLFVGSATSFSKDLERIRTQLALEDVVDFVGFRNDIPEILKSIDIYVLPSLSEGFSLTTVEAMAAGKPVIATRSGGPEKIISDGYDGILIDKASPEAIVEAVQILISDPLTATRLGENAIVTAQQKYSVDSMIQQYENLYRELL